MIGVQLIFSCGRRFVLLYFVLLNRIELILVPHIFIFVLLIILLKFAYFA